MYFVRKKVPSDSNIWHSKARNLLKKMETFIRKPFLSTFLLVFSKNVIMPRRFTHASCPQVQFKRLWFRLLQFHVSRFRSLKIFRIKMRVNEILWKLPNITFVHR